MAPSHFIVSITAVFWESTPVKTRRSPRIRPGRFAGQSHEVPNYDTALWYQRAAGGSALQLIGYVYYRTLAVEAAFQGRFNVSGDGEKAARLHIVSPRHRGDSGAYFGGRQDAAYFGPGTRLTVSGFLHCDNANEAYFGPGTRLTVSEPGRPITKPTVRVLRPSAKECGEVKAKTIVCVASGFYPDHVGVLWTAGGENVTSGVATDDAARQQDKNYHMTSRLKVSAQEFTEDRKFTCTVSFFNGTDTEYVSVSVHGQRAGGAVMTKDKYLMVTQTARFSYGFLIIKSSIFGVLVALLVWKLQRSAGKQSD
ncbi:immunoglobulin lambda-1 light chain-like [Spinachia spinachia]